MHRNKALTILRENSQYGIALENHCLRLGEFTLALAEHNGLACDEDLVFAGAYLHDIGLLVHDPSEKSYLRRGVQFVRTQTADWQLADSDRKILDEILLHNHSIKSPAGISPAAEMVRQAVQVEHSFGKLRHGLSKSAVHEVFHRYPRYNLNEVLVAFFKTVLK